MAAAVENVQVDGKQVKGIQGFIKSNRVKAEGFVQEFRGKLEKGVADAKKVAVENLDKVKGLLKKPALEKAMGSLEKARAAAEKAVGEGVKRTEETIAKLGLGKIADVHALKEAIENLSKTLDGLKKKVDGLAKGAVGAAEKPAENIVKE